MRILQFARYSQPAPLLLQVPPPLESRWLGSKQLPSTLPVPSSTHQIASQLGQPAPCPRLIAAASSQAVVLLHPQVAVAPSQQLSVSAARVQEAPRPHPTEGAAEAAV